MRAIYLKPAGELGIVDDPRLAATSERHKLALAVTMSPRQGDPIEAMAADSQTAGLIVEVDIGWVSRDRLKLIRRVLSRGRRAWLYWPAENAIECIDRERVASLRRLGLFMIWHLTRARWRESSANARARAGRMRRSALDVWRSTPKWRLPLWIVRSILRPWIEPEAAAKREALARLARRDALDALFAAARPVPFPSLPSAPDGSHRIPGCGVYLRTDFWSRIESGGSYGHTCYIARELAAVTENFVAFMAYRYRLLDDYGVRQIVIDAPSESASEEDLVAATPYYTRTLNAALQLIEPAYIYERLCLGNYTGVQLSQSLNLPYIVEYNGSEISMLRSFNQTRYVYEDFYERCEELAFRQATMISVVSEEIKRTLVARGVPESKILVNPNGADLAAYAPADAREKAAIRADLGIPAQGPVIGFTGTFGGWHGVDVLAASLPRICERNPDATFLMIGDGNFKHLIDTAVATHSLQSRVRMAGRVPQAEGARLLKACDMYVSPHNSHMVDGRFFGSPTKIFEYMAMGGGVVASDLEQIGVVLSPALRVEDLRKPDVVVHDERSVLCKPGDVEEFTEAVSLLAKRPDLCAQLGRNARRAVEQEYSWTKHVSHLWTFLAGLAGGSEPSLPPEDAQQQRLRRPAIDTGDSYKDEVQRQWDNDPAGSHYVKQAERHTLEWFREAEEYRHGEYAPWMHETMEFARHANERVLEIGGGMGTDLVQFAKNGALVTDLDLSSGHLELARENFQLRGLKGEFVLHDAESLPFDDNTFDVVYSNGVIHHTPNTHAVVDEIRRVLKPGGRAIIMVYAENSLHYWRNLVWAIGIKEGQLLRSSMGDIMSRAVERSDNASARPLVKVYTKKRLRNLFRSFDDISIEQRQMVRAEVPMRLARVPVATLGRLMGWNLIIKARKPRT